MKAMMMTTTCRIKVKTEDYVPYDSDGDLRYIALIVNVIDGIFGALVL